MAGGSCRDKFLEGKLMDFNGNELFPNECFVIVVVITKSDSFIRTMGIVVVVVVVVFTILLHYTN